jgi:hypothetical protein
MLAIYDGISTGYQLLGVVHVLAVVIAFGPLFLYPRLQRSGATAVIASLHLRLVMPALLLVWVAGMGLVGMSKDFIEMTQTWIALSLVGWVFLAVASFFMIRPALHDAAPSARTRLSAGVGVSHLVMAVVLALMIFKPGL